MSVNPGTKSHPAALSAWFMQGVYKVTVCHPILACIKWIVGKRGSDHQPVTECSSPDVEKARSTLAPAEIG